MTKLRIPLRREYPHVIVPGVRFHDRITLVVSAVPYEPEWVSADHVFVGIDLLDDTGALTAKGQETILRRMIEMTRRDLRQRCIVWGPKSCTWIEKSGKCAEGNEPPIGDTDDPYIIARLPMPTESVWTIELPDKTEQSHLCIITHNRHLVEITPGMQMVLAMFDEPVRPGLCDPAAKLLDDDGRLVAPKSFRGHRVTGVSADWNLLGEVQPSDNGIFLRNPWPDDVHAACVKVAQQPLPREITDAAWRAIHPEDPSLTYTGVREAA